LNAEAATPASSADFHQQMAVSGNPKETATADDPRPRDEALAALSGEFSASMRG
jgi:hypothetical protein